MSSESSSAEVGVTKVGGADVKRREEVVHRLYKLATDMSALKVKTWSEWISVHRKLVSLG